MHISFLSKICKGSISIRRTFAFYNITNISKLFFFNVLRVTLLNSLSWFLKKRISSIHDTIRVQIRVILSSLIVCKALKIGNITLGNYTA